MTKTSLLKTSFAIVCLNLCSLLFTSSTMAKTLPTLSVGEEQKLVTQELLALIKRYHYQPKPVDDAFANDVYNHYIKRIDSQGTYLSNADLAPFQHLSTSLDDALLANNLDDMVAMYDLMQHRRYEMFSYFIEQLSQDAAAFDFTIAEALAINAKDRPRPDNEAALKQLWKKLLKNQFINGYINEENDTQIKTRLLKRYNNQLNRLMQVTNEDMFTTIANSITSVVGPHTNYLSPRDVEDFNIDMSLSLEGIGAVLQSENDYTKISRIVVAGPADKAGELKVTDYIIGVAQAKENMVDIIGWRLDQVVDLIRGPKGTIVRLEIIPEGDLKNPSEVISITRDKVKLEDQAATKDIVEIDTELGKVKIGVITIPTFYMDFDAYRRGEADYKSTTRDVLALLKELETEAMAGLVIDLRNNGGGSLAEAKQLSSLFIQQGPIVQVGYNNGRLENHLDKSNFIAYTGPMAVLVNRASASASEIFAGAMQDYQRALIVGSQTYGKGTVQSLVDISRGQMKLTQSKFYRVTGESTQHRGVLPDINLPSLINPERLGESTLQFVLPWDRVAAQKHARYFTLGNIIPTLQKNTDARVQQSPDFLYVDKVMQRRTNEPQSLSLVLADRQALSEENEMWYLDTINTMRKNKGLEAVEKTAEHEFSYENAENDPYIQTTAAAVVDWLVLAQQP